jgi:hypothetical protein
MSFETDQWFGSRNLGLARCLGRGSHVSLLRNGKQLDAIGRLNVVFTASEGRRD